MKKILPAFITKRFSFFLIATFFISISIAQEKYSRVKIYCTDTELIEISDLGIPVDHGKRKKGYSIETAISQSDLEKLSTAGYSYEVIIDDIKAHLHAQNATPTVKTGERADCGTASESDSFDPVTPDNFELGSYAGYFTHQEMLDNLDSMASKYPDLISSRAQIGSFLTHEGRELWWVRLSDNPTLDEAEPEVLYTAIHHAREPLSLSETIYYMWWLLENYGTNEEVTYLVDNTEMYFVPMVNPDGYIHNETEEPGGGGMHRKNKNPAVGSYNPGVDLNRNYPYHWNETGTSPDENDDTYAGSGPFSEPETQAIQWFCEQRDFEFAFNAHTYGDLILFPIGWSDSEFAADHDYFVQYTDHMVVYNGYVNQKATDLYPAAGDSDDYMYISDLSAKPKIFAMTPEVGDAFWPASSNIIPTCKEMVWSNKTLAHMPHIYGVIHDLEPTQQEEMSGYFSYEIERLGLEDGDMTVSMTAVEGIESIGSANVHSLTLGEIQEDSIDFTLSSGIAFGDPITYVIHTDNGTWVRNDTISKTFGALNSVFSDDCTDLTNWTADGDWGFTDEEYVSPSNCITDSPYDGSYSNNQTSEIVLNEIFDLTDAEYAYAKFWGMWEIENDYDYVQFMVSTDGGTSWTPLCGKYTNPGTNDQDEDEPLYDGFQSDWVYEEIDLTDYIGSDDVRFKFRMVTDIWANEDGFYFDDFEIFADDATNVSGLGENADKGISIYPNPANNHLTIELENIDEIQSIEFMNEMGQVVRQLTPAETETTVDISDWAEGVYFVRTITNTDKILSERIVVFR